MPGLSLSFCHSLCTTWRKESAYKLRHKVADLNVKGVVCMVRTKDTACVRAIGIRDSSTDAGVKQLNQQVAAAVSSTARERRKSARKTSETPNNETHVQVVKLSPDAEGFATDVRSCMYHQSMRC